MTFLIIYLISLFGLIYFANILDIPVLNLFAFIPIFNVIILAIMILVGLMFFGGKK